MRESFEHVRTTCRSGTRCAKRGRAREFSIDPADRYVCARRFLCADVSGEIAGAGGVYGGTSIPDAGLVAAGRLPDSDFVCARATEIAGNGEHTDFHICRAVEELPVSRVHGDDSCGHPDYWSVAVLVRGDVAEIV